jgi:hypothetical protein
VRTAEGKLYLFMAIDPISKFAVVECSSLAREKPPVCTVVINIVP